MADEQEKLAALKMRANKLGHQIELSVKELGYCLWQSWPGVGRHMVLGNNDGVPLDAIAQKLDEIEARDHAELAHRPAAQTSRSSIVMREHGRILRRRRQLCLNHLREGTKSRKSPYVHHQGNHLPGPCSLKHSRHPCI